MIITVPTDGFSQPNFERKWVERNHGSEVLDALQPIGYKHDARVYVANMAHRRRLINGVVESGSRILLSDDITRARALVFVEMFQDDTIPNSVAERQYLGLLIYDRLPKPIRWMLRKLTGAGRNEILRDVEI